MATDELKEMLVDTYFGRDTTEKDWKRLSKKKMGPDKVEVRTFENTKTGFQMWTFGDADEECYHPAGDHYYFLYIGEDMMSPTGKSIQAAFNPAWYWKSDQCLWDQHCGFQIETVYDLPSWIMLDEMCENSFVVEVPEDKTIDDVRAAFESAGLIFNQAFHDFMESHI